MLMDVGGGKTEEGVGQIVRARERARLASVRNNQMLLRQGLWIRVRRAGASIGQVLAARLQLVHRFCFKVYSSDTVRFTTKIGMWTSMISDPHTEGPQTLLLGGSCFRDFASGPQGVCFRTSSSCTARRLSCLNKPL